MITIQQLLGITSLIQEMSEKSAFIIDSTHCINKVILCSGKNDVNHSILYKSSVRIHFSVEF
jgi:hypothetical protein